MNDLMLTLCQPQARLSEGGYTCQVTCPVRSVCCLNFTDKNMRDSRKGVTLTTFLLCDLGQVI